MESAQIHVRLPKILKMRIEEKVMLDPYYQSNNHFILDVLENYFLREGDGNTIIDLKKEKMELEEKRNDYDLKVRMLNVKIKELESVAEERRRKELEKEDRQTTILIKEYQEEIARGHLNR